jgi:prephenate dehydratase
MSCASLLFTVDDREGALEEVLKVFKDLSISLCRIESRPSKSFKWKYEIVVDFCVPEESKLKKLESCLLERNSSFQFIESSSHEDKSMRNQTPRTYFNIIYFI